MSAPTAACACRVAKSGDYPPLPDEALTALCASAGVSAAGPGQVAPLGEIRELIAADPDFSRAAAGAGVLDGFLLTRLLLADAQALRRALVMLLGQVTGRALPRTWSI